MQTGLIESDGKEADSTTHRVEEHLLVALVLKQQPIHLADLIRGPATRTDDIISDIMMLYDSTIIVQCTISLPCLPWFYPHSTPDHGPTTFTTPLS